MCKDENLERASETFVKYDNGSPPKCLHPILALALLALAAKDFLQRIQRIEQPPLVLLLSRELRRAHWWPVSILLDTFRVLRLPL